VDLLYKNSYVDIFFDRKKNLLVQKWKNKPSNLNLIFGPKSDNELTKNLNEIATTQLYDCPVEDLEAELQIMLFQYFPSKLPKS